MFKAKVYLGRLRSINISSNKQLTVLSVACLCSYNPCKLKGTQARRKKTIISGEDFPTTWKWTNNFGNRYSGRQLFFDAVDAISDLFFEDFQRTFTVCKYIIKCTTNVCADNTTSHRNCIFIFILLYVIVLFCAGGIAHYSGV